MSNKTPSVKGKVIQHSPKSGYYWEISIEHYKSGHWVVDAYKSNHLYEYHTEAFKDMMKALRSVA
jgi:hypothetical protein